MPRRFGCVGMLPGATVGGAGFVSGMAGCALHAGAPAPCVIAGRDFGPARAAALGIGRARAPMPFVAAAAVALRAVLLLIDLARWATQRRKG